MQIPRKTWRVVLFTFASLFSIAALRAGDPPAPPKLSSIVPADDLAAQAKQYVETIAASLSGQQQYAENAAKITRDAHTLAVLALALGHADKGNELKAKAPAILKASQVLAKAKDFDAAKAAFEKLQTAMTAAPEGEPAEPKWEKVASLGQLMKQVTFLNNRLKRSMRRLDKQAAESARDAAVLAAIGQAIVYDTHEVKDPNQVDQWYQLCGQMRDVAGELNAKLRLADKAGAEAALLKLAQNCDDCHKAFRIEEK